MSAKRTVVHVTTIPKTLNFLSGHIEHQLHNGWNVFVVSSPEGGELEAFAKRLGCQFVSVPMSRPISLRQDLRSLLQLIPVFRTIRPDLVHAYTPKAGLLAPIAARLTGAPGVVVSLFGLPQMTLKGMRRRVLDATTRLSTLLADAVWCDSASMRKYITQQRLAKGSKIVVLGAGSVSGTDHGSTFNPDRYNRRQLRSSLGISDHDCVIGFVGRLNMDKGLRELSAAWTQVRKRYTHAHLLLVGPEDGELPAEVLSNLTEGKRSHWLGQQANVAQWLATMDVFTMPSYREGFGVANLEASAMALPIVSTLVPGCVDSVTDGVTGTLIPPRDAEALLDAIARYIEDSELRRRHGERGRFRVESSFDPPVYWDALLSLYDQVLNHKGRGVRRAY